MTRNAMLHVWHRSAIVKEPRYAAGMPRLLPFWLLALFSSLAVTSSPAQQAGSPPPLKDGQRFTTRGRLDVQYRGWQRYLVLRLDRPYTPDFGPGARSAAVTALELSAPGRAEILSEHNGDWVEATGTLQLNNFSPYYWNGVGLLALSVTLPGGALLQSERTQPRVPPGTDFYTVTVAMVPHQFEWRREARDIETGDPLPDAAIDGCSLNGGGDVMNCLCVQSFTPVRAGIVPHPLPTSRWREIPPSAFALPGMAQFSLQDPEATHPQIVQVACKRKGPPTK